MTLGDRIAAQALGLIGVPFRLRGRSAETGLDCVGLVLLTLDRAGQPVREPPAYQLRGTGRERAERLLEAGGLLPVAQAAPGDIVLVESGPLQLHLMIRAGIGHVHAHASLGRVVLMPLPAPWPMLGIWRAREMM